jgi:hypothetical protein
MVNKIILPILILSALTFFCTATNPGLVADIKLPIITKFKNEFFESAMKQFGHQKLPDQSQKTFKDHRYCSRY